MAVYADAYVGCYTYGENGGGDGNTNRLLATRLYYVWRLVGSQHIHPQHRLLQRRPPVENPGPTPLLLEQKHAGEV